MFSSVRGPLGVMNSLKKVGVLFPFFKFKLFLIDILGFVLNPHRAKQSISDQNKLLRISFQMFSCSYLNTVKIP